MNGAMQDPLAPKSSPSVMNMLRDYRLKVQQLTSEAPVMEESTPNIWAPSEEMNPNQQLREERDHSAWLDTQPVSAQTYYRTDPERTQAIYENLADDAAFNEIKTPFLELLDMLNQYVKNGHMTKQEAMQHLAEAAPMIEDAMKRHHEADAPSMLVPRMLQKEPVILKRGKK